MDKRGIYNKGKQHHARNVNTYLLTRQRWKKWRLPLTALFIAMMLFGTAPTVGDEFQTSLLTSAPNDLHEVLTEVVTEVSTSSPEQAKKAILGALKSFIDECDRLALDSCTRAGEELLHTVSNSRHDMASFVGPLVQFEEKFAPHIAVTACRFDLGNSVAEMRSLQRRWHSFQENYGDSLGNEKFASFASTFSEALSLLEAFVQSCLGG